MLIRVISKINDIYNDKTINIFSDASYTKYENQFNVSASTSIAVVGDTIIDSIQGAHTAETNIVFEEYRGLVSSLYLANRYAGQYPNINIFSDSSLAVKGIRDYYNNWKIKNNTLCDSRNKPIKHQSCFVEMAELFNNITHTNNVGIFHQKAHIDLSNFARSEAYENMVKRGIVVFVHENNLRQYGVTEFEFDARIIRYISIYNNICDSIAKNLVYRVYEENKYRKYKEAINFFPRDKYIIE